ncbi:MAG: cyclase family protein [Acidobacteriota bacterium]|nr:cyclase family protein [Acidobacteriota bacterium]
MIAGFPQRPVYDLSQPYFVGMPHHPSHPPFLFSLTKKHGDFVDPSGMSSAADSLSMSGHTGTHIDALNHFSCNGRWFNGHQVTESQSWTEGIPTYSAAAIAPILRRGVLLDIARLQHLDFLPRDFVIAPEHLQSAATAARIEIHAGDVVLFRTGWARFWRNSREYISEVHGPGPALAGAQWLSGHGIFAAGSDTVAFEHVPDPAMPVHVHMLVERGIHLIENLNLEQLAAESVNEFLFIAAPLRIEGGTGAPVRPLAIV